MAPPRLVLLLMCFIALPTFLTFFSLLHSHPKGKMATDSTVSSHASGLRSFFSFHSPSTLFPPSAIISLTDDNSTFFLARPADFGSVLPSKGLDGQLWVGSGFGEGSFGEGGMIRGAEGELGCSDVPGWEDGNKHRHGDNLAASRGGNEAGNYNRDHRVPGWLDEEKGALNFEGARSSIPEDDGTDDHLHHPLSRSSVSKPSGMGESAQYEPSQEGHPFAHADIQSLQESAEIAGKVVLLSRGGCGFLEKAKWAQRRGGIALIVGDDTRGGPLITMYAQGDTSNVTIPSLFTAHTTAHLLSSLIPHGRLLEPYLSQGPERPDKASIETGKEPLEGADNDRPIFTTIEKKPKPTSNVPNPVRSKNRRKTASKTQTASPRDEPISWFTRLISSLGLGRRPRFHDLSENSRRPPSSGQLKWIEEAQKGKKIGMDQLHSDKSGSTEMKNKKGSNHQSTSDDFIIGIQDWRDPDLVPVKSSQGNDNAKPDKVATNIKSSNSKTTADSHGRSKNSESSLTGGIITPGSGEYEKLSSSSQGSTTADQGQDLDLRIDYENGNGEDSDSNNWLDQLFHGDDSNEKGGFIQSKHPSSSPQQKDAGPQKNGAKNIHHNHRFSEHDGLWVTLTPTTMSTSPFFDTLLVLVVSPLITLTVVYALLLLRSRIRRRRWRAPKSVVDRLPVRIYQTMSCSSTTSSSRFTTPKTSSPASPLLQTVPQSTLSWPKPHSRTTSRASDVPSLLDSRNTKAAIDQHDKKVHPLRPNNRYSGKQIECVVCLEEYVDGQSRVMSLPCGHEFHAECM